MKKKLQAPAEIKTVNVSADRKIAPDILRLVACFSVMSIHFFLNSGYYSEAIEGFGMIAMLALRLFVTTCVPVFIILTGYLVSHKTLSKKYYSNGMKVIWLYLLSSAAVIIYRVWIRKNLAFGAALWGILRYNTAPYAWYVEMYIGLFLMIPFLNILYKNIPERRWKLVLILTCGSLSLLPCIVNVYNFTVPGWWSDPTLSTDYQRLIPQWWFFGYPITYYFIGAYLREYGTKLGKVTRRCLLVVTLAVYTLYCLWRAGGGVFPGGYCTGWEFPLNAVNAALFASIMLEKKFARIPKGAGRFISYLSGLTLSAFLVSYIFDNEFYVILKQLLPVFPERLWGYFVIVPAVFICSLALAAVIDLIYRLLSRLYKKVKGAVVSRKQAKQIGLDEHSEPAQ